MQIIEKEPLAKYTTLKIGGPAEYFVRPDDIEELKQALSFAKEKKLPVLVFGSGSNILFSDDGFRGLIIKLGKGFAEIEFNAARVRAGAALPLKRLAGDLVKRGLGGLEFLAWIPGTVGGAVMMNAGAKEQAIGQKVEKALVLEEDLTVRDYVNKECGFGYRKSIFQNSKKIILAIDFKLKKEDPEKLQEIIDADLKNRSRSQPFGSLSAGSVFKNPKNTYAGKLIEEAGLKGLRIGDAQVSEKHANFIVNLGHATAKDVISLIKKVKDKVKSKSGIELEPEIKIIENPAFS